jgi:hypothetical protein
MSKPASRRSSGKTDSPRRLLYGGDVDLPESVSPKEVYLKYLRRLEYLASKKMDPYYLLELSALALKWVSTKPIELTEQDKSDLEAVLAEVWDIQGGNRSKPQAPGLRS